MPLTNYRTLGRSGLVVSPLALGTMTFGTARWGLDEAGSAAVFNAYVEAGGNFVDTADVYSAGRSEEMLGKFIAGGKLRDRIVIATKAGFAAGQGVHTGGNGAKHIHTALEGSLKRLRTDYVDGLKKIAAEAGETPARIALAWVCGRPGVTSTLMGVSRPEQVKDNAAALDIVLSPEHREELDKLSAPADLRMLYSLFTPIPRQYAVFGGASVGV